MYAFVREDIPLVNQLIQCCHACMESTRLYPPLDSVIPNLVVLAADNENNLNLIAKELELNSIKYVLFREPDMNNEITAIATEPLFITKRKVFRNYKLLEVKHENQCA